MLNPNPNPNPCQIDVTTCTLTLTLTLLADYKRISKYEYMTLESEPDLQYVFPSLLPKPGAGGL